MPPTIDAIVARLRSALDRRPISAYSTCVVMQADLRQALDMLEIVRGSNDARGEALDAVMRPRLCNRPDCRQRGAA